MRVVCFGDFGIDVRIGPDQADTIIDFSPGFQFKAATFNLADLLKATQRNLLELGRSCLHPDYRSGTGVFALWSALADYVAEQGVEILFGVASFHGTDPQALAQPLSQLHHAHLAPDALRVRSQQFQRMDLLSSDQVDRVAAMKQTPALIKAYLRLGGTVGEGAFVDHAFNTVDICLILESDAIQGLQRTMLTSGIAHG